MGRTTLYPTLIANIASSRAESALHDSLCNPISRSGGHLDSATPRNREIAAEKGQSFVMGLEGRGKMRTGAHITRAWSFWFMFIYVYAQKMNYRLREIPTCLRHRLRRATVVMLSLALLALPCSHFAEALGSPTGDVVGAASSYHSDHGHVNGTYGAADYKSNCCIDCSAWLAARFDDGDAAIIAHNWSRSDLFMVALAHAPSVATTPTREQRFTGPPSTAFVDGTWLYAKTERYRI